MLASWHPLFTGSPAYAELKPELDRRGLEYLNTELPTGAAFPDGSAAFLTTSLEDNVAELARHAAADGPAWEAMFDAFMANADLSFGVLGTELWSSVGARARAAPRSAASGAVALLEYVGGVLASCRDWLGDTFESDAAHGLLAPWVLHTGLGPDQATSGFMTQVIACALQLGGMPVPKGGGVVLVDGLAGIVRDAGGEVRTGVDVERVLVSGGKATAVRLAGGETIRAERAVVAGVTPTQLYGRLLGSGDVPDAVTTASERFRYGRGAMQIHIAMSEPPDWYGDERLATDGDRARDARPRRRLARGERGRARPPPRGGDDRVRPADGRRPVARAGRLVDPLDPAPGAPRRPDQGRRGGRDRRRRRRRGRRRFARRTPTASPRGSGRHIQNLERATRKRVVLSPADIEALNVNLVGGDIYGGSCALDQNFLFRPLPQAPGHRTAVDNLWHVGASTHPGPGLGAGSGYLVYKELTKAALPRRVLSRAPAGASMKLSLSEISTVNALFEEDVVAYAAAGFDGIGIWEMKLPQDDEANVELLHERRPRRCELRAGRTVDPSARHPGHGGPGRSRRPDRVALGEHAPPRRVRARVRARPHRALARRRARGRSSSQGLREVAAAARDAGVRLGLEPAHPAQHESVSFVNSIADALELLDEAGLDDVGLMVDTYNLWHESPAALAAVADRVTGLHVADEPSDPDRTDRALPGEGGLRSAEHIAALRRAGWDGYLDVEIFSTPDGFWALPVDEAARRGVRAPISKL